ncbi:MAG: leucyl aminopeptidase [candidate division WOR-3 bacterium]|nr:leucyl aminopeptidase [candidate division WOR-3 bacterium]MCX7947238.1 leucyl aminopeptidase [candidate division WOR-3 bacterium]MDW8150293.1 leucyl aminopeptidase [candidate division WOR-3 bacterium]
MISIKFIEKQEDIDFQAIFEPSDIEESISFIPPNIFKVKFENTREYIKNISNMVKQMKLKRVGIKINDEVEKAIEELYLQHYVFDKYKTKKEDLNCEFYIFSKEKDYTISKILAESTNYTRNLVNEPPNVIYPETLKDEAINLGKTYGFDIEVFDRKKLKDLGFNAFLAVSSGSIKEPYFVHISYKRGEPKIKLAIVGKALTFDSGGLNIKTYEGMVDMKIDMAGAGVVLGVFKGLGELKLDNIEVHGFFAACENLPSGSAMKPGDVVRAYNGKTIEILNTDAEGRLTFADVLSYVSKNYKLDYIIDFATLTGAIVVALGEYRAGIFTPNRDLYNKIEYYGSLANENYWLMPLDENIAKKLKSKVADVKNTGDRAGGAIFAALFLREFLEDPNIWAHIDIAGVAYSNEIGATGFGVRTILYWLLNL